MSNTSIDLVNLDFDSLKSSFVEYLRAQPKFKDYDFEGSNLNVLLDILSYNSFHNTFFLNMAISEGFLDSAQLKNSVFSHAKELNYLPRSVKSAKSRVSVSFKATGESQPYVIQKGQSFSTMIKNTSFVFSIPESIIVSSSNTSYSFTTDVYEGVYLKDTFLYLNTSDPQKFRLTNDNVDVESITVTVYEDNSLFGKTFIYSDTLLDINEFSNVYFLQASETGYYEVIFGDGILGAVPKFNSTIIVDYRLSAASAANGAKSFVINFDPTGAVGELLNSPNTQVIAVASGGVEAESIDSIKYYAPKHFQVQDRAIVPSDYELILKKQFPEIDVISAFGGEELIPPQYGKIFISVSIKNLTGIPDLKKKEYTQFIKRKNSLSITPVFLVPEVTYLQVKSSINYNVNLTSDSSKKIKAAVTNTIVKYNTDYLNDFNKTLRYSKLLRLIDDTDPSIVSNNTDLKIYKKIIPKINVATNVTVNFGIPIQHNYGQLASKYPLDELKSLSSSRFKFSGEVCQLDDDGNGNVRIVKVTNDSFRVITNIGSIDYTNGLVNLNNINIDSFEGDYLKLYISTVDVDITVAKNNIFRVEPDEIYVTEVIPVRE